ncbi:MAG TPA: GNAT family N-acetyltransferase [Bryobacteraceae bacterium]|nr:GNAT family N-acetyltransferase [Bryobacteraceae bacterium]
MSSGRLTWPEKLSAQHELSDFDSGEPVLDDWLRRRAAQNEAAGASRTYIVCAGKKVAGYYSLAVGAAAHAGSPGRVKRNMPDPIPVMILARLAVDKSFQGQGVGAGLLRDAIFRTVQAGEIAGIRALLVHAISERAKRFYEGYGFIPSPMDPLTLMITLAEAQKLLGGEYPR